MTAFYGLLGLDALVILLAAVFTPYGLLTVTLRRPARRRDEARKAAS